MTRLQKNISVLVVALALAAAFSSGGGISSSPPPITEAGLNVLILEESNVTHTLPEGQQDILASQGWRRAWMDAGGEVKVLDPVGEDGIWRDFHGLPAKWQQGLSSLKETPLPAYAVSNGRSGEKGALPQTLEEWEKLLAKYRGP